MRIYIIASNSQFLIGGICVCLFFWKFISFRGALLWIFGWKTTIRKRGLYWNLQKDQRSQFDLSWFYFCTGERFDIKGNWIFGFFQKHQLKWYFIVELIPQVKACNIAIVFHRNIEVLHDYMSFMHIYILIFPYQNYNVFLLF